VLLADRHAGTARDENAAEQALNAQHPNTSTPAFSEENRCPQAGTVRHEKAAEQALNTQHPNTSTPAFSGEMS